MRLRPTKPIRNRSRLSDRAGMVTIPSTLRPDQLQKYPPDNAHPFERWYMDSYSETDQRSRLYLPIQWTALYCNNNYGACQKTKLQIQSFLDGLDRSKKYYTIVQYDDGILNNLSNIDIKVFAMSGPRIDYALPLISAPHQYIFPNEKKDIFASFVGRITHPIRTEIIKQLEGKDGYYISTKPHSLREYCNILARSKYALCPRGYGQTSFRIQEAIQYDALPVYTSDFHIFPYIQSEPSPLPFLVHALEWAPDIDQFLKVMDVEYGNKMKYLNAAKHLFTYPGCKSEILNVLKESDEVQ